MAEQEAIFSSYGRRIKTSQRMAEYKRDIEREISLIKEEISRIEDQRSSRTPTDMSVQPQHAATSTYTPALAPAQPTPVTESTPTPTLNAHAPPFTPVHVPTATPAHMLASTPAHAPIATPAHMLASTPAHMLMPVEHLQQASATDEMLAKLVSLFSQQSTKSLPQMEPDIFSQDILNFPVWLKSFESLIESRAKTEGEKLFYLSKYTAGDAKQAIQGYIILGGNDAYTEAKATLIRRYGDRYKLAQRFKERLNAWPAIKTGDGEAMVKLSDFLDQCSSAMTSTHHLDCLNNAEETMKILDKLPRYMMDRWSRTVDRWLYGEERRYPPFPVFVAFVNSEARVASGPCKVLSKQPNDSSYRNKASSKSVRTFATSSEVNSSVPPAPENKEAKGNRSEFKAIKTENRERQGNFERSPYCNICAGPHSADECKEFFKLDLEERRGAAKAKGVCFKCLRKGHLVRECKRTGSLLFKDLPGKDGQTPEQSSPAPSVSSEHAKTAVGSFKVSVCAEEGAMEHCSPIVPVVIHLQDNPQKTATTYAVLDNQSSGCFITNALADKLNATQEAVDLKLTTMARKEIVSSNIVEGIVIRGEKEAVELSLPSTYTSDSIPVDHTLIPTPEALKSWPHLQKIPLCAYNPEMEVGLLIGFNCSVALLPRQIVTAGDNEPFAVKTDLGWGVTGPVSENRESASTQKHSHFAFRTQVQEVSPLVVSQLFEREFEEEREEKGLSMDDRKFLKSMQEEAHQQDDGHFVLPLPLKNSAMLPNNRDLAMKRLQGLTARMKKNKQYSADYRRFMSDLIDKGYAERISNEELEGKEGCVWYIPHHGVYHPKKPNKIRVVFDCSAEYRGEVLNRHLLSGPDMTNNLTGVLLRFRHEEIAVTCDIEAMFHQVVVSPEHRDYLRFLWFENDSDQTPTEYRMTVHLFGATSSPACANFALKSTANKYESECGSVAADFVRNSFYVDDGLKSVSTREEAKHLITRSHKLCEMGGFNLQKYICSEKEVLESIPTELQEKSTQPLDLAHDHLPTSRALGVEWNVEDDVFQFQLQMREMEKPVTRRGILSTVSSIYDPLGLVSPALLTGRKILQDLCRDGCGWDDDVPENDEIKWKDWIQDICHLSEVKIPRCYKNEDFGDPMIVELHHFADASLIGYGQCSYLRLVNKAEQASSTLVMSKSRVTPSKPVTVPRLELTAAVLAAKVARFLEQELSFSKIKHYFWTDSRVVLGYIRNETRRFHMYVANRVQRIRESTSKEDWNYIDSRSNPADLTSRGATVNEIKESDMWWHGPVFLRSSQPVPENKEDLLDKDDPEIKKVTVHTASTETTPRFSLSERLKYFSSWHRACKAVARCLRLKYRLMNPKVEKMDNHLGVADVQQAEKVIIRAVQEDAFSKEREAIAKTQNGSNRKEFRTRMQTIKQKSSLYRLDPFVDEDGLIRVGGRIKKANIPRELANPVIMPRQGHITTLVIHHFHLKTFHAGTNTTLNEIRASGFWIIKGRAAVASHVWNCVACRKLRASTMSQKMSDLPVDRLEPAPPFTASGVDMFGPFYVKEGRSEKKRWGVIFTCLTTRAIHIEVARALTTDSFINAYRRFVGRRGVIRTLRCDCGTNFVGAKNELEAALKEMDNDKIHQRLLKDGCDWISFQMNIPHSSHMGGVWERMIRSVRGVLSGILLQHGDNLDDELLQTFMVEAEAIVNSRPLTYHDNSSDSPEPLTPSQLLTLKSKVVLPPPGNFVKEDMFCRKRWRRVQYLANEFWTRWRKEYLPTLQDRRKWTSVQDSIKPGDVVLMAEDNTPRCQWPLGVIAETFASVDGHARKVRVKTSSSSYERPITKIVHVYRPGSTTREPSLD